MVPVDIYDLINCQHAISYASWFLNIFLRKKKHLILVNDVIKEAIFLLILV